MARALSLAGPALAAVLALPGAASAQVEGWLARLDFGLSAPDCPGVQALIGLRNAGEAPLVIEGARFEGAGFLAFDSAPALPLTVGPGSRLSLGVRLVSPLDGPWAADLVIETSEGPLISHLHGVVASEITDRFAPTPRHKVDILLLIDDAPSMQEVQEGLHANMANLAELLVAMALDAHVGVITPTALEGGRLRALPSGARFVRTLDPGAAEALRRLADVGTAGTGERLGLWAIKEALTAHATGDNAGFLRPDAVLSVLVVSDAEDLSPGSLDGYLDALRAIKGFEQRYRFVFSAVGTAGPLRCSGPGGDAQSALRYDALADATGGVRARICDADWSRRLEEPPPMRESRFLLSAAPVPESLEVRAGGRLVPATEASGTVNWTYYDLTESVDFTPFSMPGWGEQLEVLYRPRTCGLARP